MKKSVSALLAIFLIPSAAFCAATGDASIPTKASPTTSDKVTIGDAADVNSTTGKLKSKDATLGSLPVSAATQTALNGKANASAFANQAAFTAAWGWTPGGGDTFDQAGDYTLTGSWDFTGATVTGISGGSMVYPGAGISISTGSAWGISITPGTGVATALASPVDGTGGLASKASLDALPNIVFGTGIAVAEDTPSAGTDTVSIDADTTPTDGSAKPITSDAVYDALAGKQATLVSGDSIKTINNTSLLGSGNINITGGTGGGLTSTLSVAPYSDVACTSDGVYNHTLYKCVDNGSGTGYFTEYVSTTAYSNTTPVESCATQSVLLDKSGSMDGATNIYSSNNIAGFMINGNGKKLHSIHFKSSSDNGSSGTYNIYVNTNTVFSGSVTDNFSIVTPGTANTEFTGLSSSRPTLVNGTTYYIGVHSASIDWGNRVSLQTISDPANQNLYIGSTGIDSMVQALGNGTSLWAKVYVCD